MKPLVVKVLPNGQTVQTVLDDSRYRDGTPLRLNTPRPLRRLEYTDAWLKETIARKESRDPATDRDFFNIWTGQADVPVAALLEKGTSANVILNIHNDAGSVSLHI